MSESERLIGNSDESSVIYRREGTRLAKWSDTVLFIRPLRVKKHASDKLLGTDFHCGTVISALRDTHQTARDFTQRLCPSRRGVRHHGHVVAHVAEVLSQGDACKGSEAGVRGNEMVNSVLPRDLIMPIQQSVTRFSRAAAFTRG